MRVTLQDKVTQQYVCKIGQWTAFSWQAQDFQCYDRAVAFVLQNDLPNMQIELGFVETGQKFLLPIEGKIGV
jgi:hypothetical protein